MANLKRNFSQQTVKILFALNGNQCAYPKCTNTLIERETEKSDAHVTGEICHIYAISPEGPRGNPGLTQQEINAPDNLILLCPYHHAIVDGQHETYSADMLKQWKQMHEAKMQRRPSPVSTALLDSFSHLFSPVVLIDQKIEEEIENLRRSRFFQEFDKTSSSLKLGGRLAERELSGGSDEIRSRGLAWCARLLSQPDTLNKAEEFLKLAKTLGDGAEIQIADAFLLSQKGNKGAALQVLAVIDSAASCSAGLMIVGNHDRAKGAIKWMNDSGYTSENLDSDGKCMLLNYHFRLGHWNDSTEIVATFSDTDFAETPALHHMAALAKLVSAVPMDFRHVVVTQVPYESADFPLASDAISMDARRVAHSHFLDGVKAAIQLDCPHAASIDDEYALWLELRDPSQRDFGKNRLQGKLRDLSTALGFVHYGLQFDIKLDLDAVEREIDRNMAINGGMTTEAAVARYSLAFTKSSDEEAANYIARHQDQLAAHVDSKLIRYRQVELFSRAGLFDRANTVLNQLLEERLPAKEENKLRRIISEAQGIDPVESRKAQYQETGALLDLMNLVDELQQKQHWDNLCEYGWQLFQMTHTLRDAERLVDAFNNTLKSEALVEFLEDNAEILEQSKNLQMSYAWGLYYTGALLRARDELSKLSEDEGSRNYRALQVNIGIAIGDWASLSAYISNEYQKRNDRSAHDLMGVAQLALPLGSPHARDLVFEAASKAEGDATILATAYFVATSAGWEDEPQVFQWLQLAAELSDSDGPLQRMSLKDVFERKPEWDRRESETWRLLVQGQAPIFIAAQSLNRTLIDLTIFPALANLAETDPRRRNAIPTYSGKRIPRHFDISGKSVALDATSLLTLSFLNILDVVFDELETVYIPHSTLGWLFNEHQKTPFHQPSRIENARKIRDLLATNKLEKFTPNTVASSELSTQVGDELAALIAEAEKIGEGEDTQQIVVRSAPVHRLSSLMEEEADLSAHVSVLSSCFAVVTKLREKGEITAEEEKRSQAYLQLHEKPWPNQPEIADGATLYLDDLAIHYLLHLGLLGKLKDAGLRPVASPDKVSEADVLIAYERISDDVTDVIERIRATLNSQIESGQVKVGGRHMIDETNKNSIPEHPTLGAIALAPRCDAVVVDDRFINQNANVDSDGVLTPLLSTVDLLDTLASSAVITVENLLDYRTKLRRAGYFFIPINEKELKRCLKTSSVVDGKVVETAELKSIRQSVLRVRMSDCLQLPIEAPWLEGTLKTFVKVLKNLWQDGADINEIMARSNWLVDQIDVRGWAHSIAPENADNFVHLGRGSYILLILTPPTDVQREIVDAYWNWVEGTILAPVKEQFPDLYVWLVKCHRNQVLEMAEIELLGGGDS